MKGEKRTEIQSILTRALSALFAFVILCFAVLYASNSAFGWFNKRLKVDTKGFLIRTEAIRMDTQYGIGIMTDGTLTCSGWHNTAAEAFYVTNGTTTTSVFSQMHPGDMVYLAVKYGNAMQRDYYTALSLTLGQEVCQTVTNGGTTTYYYLGSQLRVNRAIAYSTNASNQTTQSQVTVGKYLVPNPSTLTGFTAPVSQVNAISVASGLRVPVNGTLTVYLEVEFADNGQSQNAYQNFGSTGGKCSRNIQADFSKT